MPIELAKKYIIKLPKNIQIYYFFKNSLLVCEGPLGKKQLVINKYLIIFVNSLSVGVDVISFNKLPNNLKKKIKSIQGTTVSLIKQLIQDVLNQLCEKLKLVGVGYRALPYELSANKDNFNSFLFKLGFSHQIYFKSWDNVKLKCTKNTNLFLFSNSYQHLTQTLAVIRLLKKPEPYKGKGILYNNEKIVLKEGKKI